MLRLRIGNDLTIRATVTRLGEPEDFTGKTLSFTLKSAYERITLPFVTVGNEIIATWLGSQQSKTGEYSIVLQEDYGDGSRNTTDQCRAFQLVSCTCQEGLTGSQTCSCQLSVGSNTGGLKLDISSPANGLSAYEIAVQHGFEGTEAEWLASLSASTGSTMVAPFMGSVSGVNLSTGTVTADYIAYDTDRHTFLAAKVSEDTGRAAYYAEWDNTTPLTASLYGAASDDGHVPTAHTLYMDVEEYQLFYATDDGLKACYEGIPTDELKEMLQESTDTTTESTTDSSASTEDADNA